MTEALATGELRPDEPIAEAHSVSVYRLFSRGYTVVRCTAFDLRFEGKPAKSQCIRIDDSVRIVNERRWFWRRLIVHGDDHRTVTIGGLGRRPAAEIEEAVAKSRTELAVARKQAIKLQPLLLRTAEQANRLFDGSRYIRHSVAAPLLAKIQRASRNSRSALVRRQLDAPSVAALEGLEDIGTTKRRFESSRSTANERFVASAKTKVLQAAEGVISHPPTDEQVAAIATDEDVTQVLAGAGAGKTAVITCKVAHLVRNVGVHPWQILVLAFNRKAAEEIQERLPSDLAGVEARTFHGFGRQVIADSEAKPKVSPMAEADTRLKESIRNWLFELPNEVTHFGAYLSNEYRSPFDFGTFRQYVEFVRSCDLCALAVGPPDAPTRIRSHGAGGPRTDRDRLYVGSLEELLVANFLTLHGLPFEYRAAYDVPLETREDRQFERYRPTFRLSGHDLYIEPFALDGNGQGPRHFTHYEARVNWRRRAHEHFGTRLIEVHTRECADGSLPNRLRTKLERAGLKVRPMHTKGLLDRVLARTRLDETLATFLNHARGAGLSPNELQRRASQSDAPTRNLAFLRIFESIRERYEQELASRNELDWNDMIIRGARLIEQGRWKPPYRYVLVDEFQDISAGRMRLLQALKGDDVAFFVVGDDWQSINRFAGSDVGLFQECERYLGHVETCNLSRTFRYGQSILGPTSAFVQRNPTQTRRKLHSAGDAPDDGITVVAASEQKDGVIEVLDDIEAASIKGGAQDPKPSVLVLGRYRNGRADVPGGNDRGLDLDFSTVHRAKGLEADYAVVLMDRFPSRKQDDPTLRMVLPRAKGAVPYGEERRLFYVATTRARRGLYLVVNDRWPSPFVWELLDSSDDFRKLGSFVRDGAPPCPVCAGVLIPSGSGKNLRCTNWPVCPHLAPCCSACGTGYLVADDGHAACTNNDCGQTAQSCPVCQVGVVVPRNGRYGQFLGCSGYSSEPPCHYTRDA